MKNRFIKISILLLTIILFSIIGVNQSKATTEVATGSCGDSITWSLDSNGVLTISGSGEMTYNQVTIDGSTKVVSPWYEYKEQVKSVVFDGEITSIAMYAFRDNNNLEEIELPNSVKSLGTCAFSECSNLKSITFTENCYSIGEYAFYNCTSLEKIDLVNSNVVYIYANAFNGCTSLKSVTIRAFFASINSGSGTISDTAKIYGYEYSSAYYYARNNNRTFVDLNTNEETREQFDNNTFLTALPTSNVKTLGITAHHSRFLSDDKVLVGYTSEFCDEKDTTNATYQEMQSLVDELTADCKTDKEKAKAILNWMNYNIEYKSYPAGNAKIENVYTAFNRKTGNCEVHTLILNYLLYLSGIPTATATNVSHMWTVAFIDGTWVYIDATAGQYNYAGR